MPRIPLNAASVPIRTADNVRAVARQMSASLSLVVDRDIRISVDGLEIATPPFEAAAPDRIGFEFSVHGAAAGKALVVLDLRDAVTLSGLLCMVSAAQIEERRREPVLAREDADSLHEIGNLLRGAIEVALRDQSPVQLHVSATGADGLKALLGDRAAAWPQGLVARMGFSISGFEAGSAEIFLETAVARALDPSLDVDDAAIGAGKHARLTAARGAMTSKAGLPTVLVLEPDPFYLELLVAALDPHARVVTASSVSKLRALLRDCPRATLVIDVPDGDADVMAEIAAICREAAAPTLLATLAVPTRSAVVQLAQAGVKHILPKPYSRITVVSRLKALLGG